MIFELGSVQSLRPNDGERELQAAVDPLDGVAFVLGDDAFLNVGVHLLVHEVLQLGEVII